MKRSDLVKNLALGNAIKVCLDNEETIKKEIGTIMEKEENKAVDQGKRDVDVEKPETKK